MKHITVLSNQKPAMAEETAFLTLKNVLSGNLPNDPSVTPTAAAWFNFQIESLLQK